MINAGLGLAKGVSTVGMTGVNIGMPSTLAHWIGKGLYKTGIPGVKQVGGFIAGAGIRGRRTGAGVDRLFNKAMNMGPKWQTPLKLPANAQGKFEFMPSKVTQWKPYELTVGKALNGVGTAAMMHEGFKGVSQAVAPPPIPAPPRQPSVPQGMPQSIPAVAQNPYQSYQAKVAAAQDFAALMAYLEENDA